MRKIQPQLPGENEQLKLSFKHLHKFPVTQLQAMDEAF